VCISVLNCIGKIMFINQYVCCSNEGPEAKKLTSCGFLSQVDSSQFEVSAVQLDEVDLAHSSRKAQQMLPISLESGKSATVTVFCTARYL
jgi:hypothetical protein